MSDSPSREPRPRTAEDERMPIGVRRGYTRKIAIASVVLVVLVVIWGLAQPFIN